MRAGDRYLIFVLAVRAASAVFLPFRRAVQIYFGISHSDFITRKVYPRETLAGGGGERKRGKNPFFSSFAIPRAARRRTADARKKETPLCAARKSACARLPYNPRTSQNGRFLSLKSAGRKLFPWHGIQPAHDEGFFSFLRSDKFGLSLSLLYLSPRSRPSFSPLAVLLALSLFFLPLSSRFSPLSRPLYLISPDALLRGFIYVFSAEYECPQVAAESTRPRTYPPPGLARKAPVENHCAPRWVRCREYLPNLPTHRRSVESNRITPDFPLPVHRYDAFMKILLRSVYEEQRNPVVLPR